MSQIQARFILNEATRIHCHRQQEKGSEWERTEGVRVKLSPATGEPFGSATPGGSLEMIIANPEAAKIFNDAPIGQEFGFLITPVG